MYYFDTDSFHNGGYAFINIPSLAAYYIMEKRRYKKRLLMAMDDRAEKEEFWKDDYFINIKIAGYARKGCNEILSVIRKAKKMEDFNRAVKCCEYAEANGLSLKIVANSIYGLKFTEGVQ